MDKIEPAKTKKFPLSRRVTRQVLLAVAFVAIFVIGVVSGIAYELKGQGLDMTQFWRVYTLLQQNYVGSINKKTAEQGAINGLVNSLGDPFTYYLDSSQKTDLNTQLDGSFDGIGAELTQANGQATVVTPLAGTPAETAGLKANDVIQAINGKSTANQGLDTVVDEIRGPKGSIVTLTVARPNVSAPITIKITREDITVPSVNSKMLNNNVGYIQITQFGTDTVTSFQQQLSKLQAQNPKAYIIDLRDDPGGYLDDVAPIAGDFVPPSVVVQVKDKTGQIQKISTDGLPTVPQTPLYILVNSGTASAAEIFAGAMQDDKRATLIGEKTYGKGSVQDVIDLSNNTALRVTIDAWLTPKGHTIEHVGLTPDVKVTDDTSNGTDAILNKALSLISGQ